MSGEFHQITQVEMTTDQLIMAKAMVGAAIMETERYIKKLENKEIEVHPGELDDAKADLEKAQKLMHTFTCALAGIMNTWGKDDE